MASKYDGLVNRALDMGAGAARLIGTDQIKFDPRARLKCRFGCNRWGRYWTCPPHMDLSQEQFMAALKRYTHGLVIQSKDPRQAQEITLALEKEAMFTHGATFAMALAMCVMCEDCALPEPCLHPDMARPTLDAFAIDVGRTVEPLGFEVKFNAAGKLLPAWYSMVLL